MSDTYQDTVRRTLDALLSTGRAAVERQIPFTAAGDDFLEMAADACILSLEGLTADKISQVIRDRQIRARLDQRVAGRAAALDVAQGMPGCGLHQSDPAELLEAMQSIEALQASDKPCGARMLPVADIAGRCHRGLRSVQTTMRRICRSEAGGQMTLPGMPAAGDVYSARALVAFSCGA
jgi:hypothetical protein